MSNSLTSRNNFLTKLYKPDSAHGTAWYESLSLPADIKPRLLQRCLIDNNNVPTLQALHCSYGHQVRKGEKTEMHDLLCPDDYLRPIGERRKELSDAFLKLNDPTLSLKQRLALWDHAEPGFVLAVVGGLDNSAAGIGCISCPVCTQMDVTDTGTFGAPKWDEVFDDDVVDLYLSPGSTQSHCIVGSLAHDTWKNICEDKQTFLTNTLPVVMPDGRAIGCKPMNGEVFQLLFIPVQGEAPVGVFMDTSTSFDDYKKNLANPKVYLNYHYLLKKHDKVFRDWFNAVNANPVAFKVPLVSAMPMWNTFPTVDKPEGEKVLDVPLLEPFVVQQNRFVRAILDDAILRAPVGNRQDEEDVRCMYDLWRSNALQCYPTELGAERAIGRQAFLEEMLPPEQPWPAPFDKWSVLLKLDEAIPLPSTYKVYGSQAIPNDPAGMTDWSPKRLQKPQATNRFAAFRQAKANQRAQVTPANTTIQVTPAASQQVQHVGDATNHLVTPADKATAMRGVPITTSPKQTSGPNTIDPSQQAMHGQSQTPQWRMGQLNFATPAADGTNGISQAAASRPGSSTETAIGVATSPPSKRHRVGWDFNDQHAQGWHDEFAFDNAVSDSARPGQSTLYSPDQEARRRSRHREYDPFHQQPLIFANGVLATAKHALVANSKIVSVDDRKKCSPAFLQLCLFCLLPAAPGRQAALRTRGSIPSEDLLYVKPPTEHGTMFLTGFDHGNNGDDAAQALAATIKHRWVTEQLHVGCPTHYWETVMTADFVKRAYNPAVWQMSTDRALPLPATKRHTLLCFLPLVDENYGTTAIPAEGIPWRKMSQLCRLIYYVYSTPFCKDNNGRFDDGNFARSVFGQSLKLMCRFINNYALEPLWAKCQIQCTVEFLQDLSELFHNLQRFVEYHRGGMAPSCGIDDAKFQGEQRMFVAVPASLNSDLMSDIPRHYVREEEDYRRRMRETWARTGYNVRDPKWSQESVSFLLPRQTLPSGLRLQDPQRRGNEQEGTGDTKRRQKKIDGPKVPFKNTTPLFEFVGDAQVSTSEDVMRALRKAVTRGHFPHVQPGDTGGKKASLCLHSAFKGFCACPDTRACKSRKLYPGYVKERIHVDLSDQKWQKDAFPESKWNSIVSFLNSYKDYVRPTEAFKKLTPSTQWQ